MRMILTLLLLLSPFSYALPNQQTYNSSEVQNLKQEKRIQLTNLLNFLENQSSFNVIDLDKIYKIQNELLFIEFDLATTKNEKIKLYDKIIALEKKRLQVIETKFKAGVCSQEDFILAKIRLIDIQIQCLQNMKDAK